MKIHLESSSSPALGFIKAASVALLSLSLLTGKANAHDIPIDWTASVSGALIGLSRGNIIDNGLPYAGTFTVPVPNVDSISEHSQQHDYLRTDITGFVFEFSNSNPKTFASAGSFGKLASPLGRTQGFSISQLFNLIPAGETITSVTASGTHVFSVPEPETYLLVFCGLGVLWWRRIKTKCLEPNFVLN